MMILSDDLPMLGLPYLAVDSDLGHASECGSSETLTPKCTTGLRNDCTAPSIRTHDDTILSIPPTDADIICGRTSKSKHPGNCFFRELIVSHSPKYMVARKKHVKGQVVSDILSSLESNGVRFMKWNEILKEWESLDLPRCREKISHALRDRVRELKNGKSKKNAKNPSKKPIHKSSHKRYMKELAPGDSETDVAIGAESRPPTLPSTTAVSSDPTIGQTMDLCREPLIDSTDGIWQFQESSETCYNSIVSFDIEKSSHLHHQVTSSSRGLAIYSPESCDILSLRDLLDDDDLSLALSDDNSNDLASNAELGDLDLRNDVFFSTLMTDFDDVTFSAQLSSLEEDFELKEVVLSLHGACDLFHSND